MTIREGLAALRANLGGLDADSRTFAESLISQADRTGSLSDKQAMWVGKLLRRAATRPETVGNLAGLIDFLRRGGARAKVVLRITDDLTVKIGIAGDASRQPGSLTITSPGRVAWEDRVFYGRVGLDGAFKPADALRPEHMAPLVEKLRALLTDPAGTAAAHGHLTGECCFCELPLEDARSVHVGYGPVCAKKYALPYPKKSEVA